MNIEMSRIREKKGYKPEINREPTRIKVDTLEKRIKLLNINLYQNSNKTINDCANSLAKNIYVILYMFNEMGIYPDYFYDEATALKLKRKELIQSNKKIENINTYINALTSNMINDGINNGRYRFRAYDPKDTKDNWVDMTKHFMDAKIFLREPNEEDCKKILNRIKDKQSSILEILINSDHLSDDIECLIRLLHMYMKFFATMGICPKEYIDKVIEQGIGLEIEDQLEEISSRKK